MVAYLHPLVVTSPMNDTQKEIVETECRRQLENKSLERLVRDFEKD